MARPAFNFKGSDIRIANLLLSSALAPLQALAQATPAERIEITGSSIRRIDAETASPVQIIRKSEIDQAGKGTLAEYLQTLTADGQGSVPFTYGRGFTGSSAAGISLRGLGVNATLVLINGRRVAPAVLADDAQRQFVDLNQIPLEAVERVEVLKDGASSIYGSDAVAGVVNIILKKTFVGTVLKASYGVAAEGDGNEPRVALTHGFGNLASDGYNVLLNAEFGKKEPIYNRDRRGRGAVGVSAIGQPEWGFDPNASSNNLVRVGGNGWIPVTPDGTRLNNAGSPSFVGNVRNPFTNNYYSRSDPAGVGFTRTFPAAAALCAANANLPQNNTAGGCITDLRREVNQIQPEQQTSSFYGRVTRQLGGELEAFLELGHYQAKTRVDALPPAPGGSVNQRNGQALAQTVQTQLGAAHPDNPYFGTAARISYLPLYDPGIAYTTSQGDTSRLVAGLKGTLGGWGFDAGITLSEARQTDTAHQVLNYRVKNALLDPSPANVAAARAFSPAYAALPANSYWRIAENAGLNSAALYDALLDDLQRKGFARQHAADARLTGEVGQLPGGPIGVALGVEARHEETDLPFYDGLGDYIGLPLTAYAGQRDIAALYGELLLPLLKRLEVSAALRHDRYSDAGNSTTPKLGVKWRALDSVALRGTVSRGFRAPSPTENSTGSIFGFGGPNVNDEVRCAALAAGGLPPATVTANCRGLGLTFVGTGNPALRPETSRSATLGLVWDVFRGTSIAADLWQIKRQGLPVIESNQAAIDAGRYTRDPATALVPGDPGRILQGFVIYQNSNQSLTRGFDLEVKHRADLGGGRGRVSLGGTWSHLFTQRVIDSTGVRRDYAGTHGNCDITNCAGSPKDRVSLAATWETAALWRVGANVNHRGSLLNKFAQSDTACAQRTANGADYPDGCKLASFTTLDVSAAWQFGRHGELFGSVANVTDRTPPPDFATYGAVGYNPLDYSGAIGRYVRVGVKLQF